MPVKDDLKPKMPSASSDEALLARKRRGESILLFLYRRKEAETQVIVDELRARGAAKRSSSYRRTKKAKWFESDVLLALTRLVYEGMIDIVAIKTRWGLPAHEGYTWGLTFEGWVSVANHIRTGDQC